MRLWELPVMFFSLGILLLLIGCVPPAESERTAGAGLAISKGCYDADNDGYGRKGNSIVACPGSTNVYDCDDTNASIRPYATDFCGNGIDEDCSGSDCAATCGNGIVESGEECDDGNSNDADECTNTCQLTSPPFCGNGRCETYENDVTNPNYCTRDCVTCGNGIIESTETCDDGNTISGDGCSNTCDLELPPACGNGICETYENDVTHPDYCARDCAVCGNGIVESGELCDDGNAVNGDGCTQCQCADSDGGIDQYEGGTVTTSAGAMNDYCDQKVAIDPSRSIFERYCGDDGTVQVIEKRCGDDVNPLYINEFLASGQGCYINSPSIPYCVLYG